MAWSVQAGTPENFASSTSWNDLDLPDDIAVGDWLYILYVSDSDHTVSTPPSGYTEVFHSTLGSTGTTFYEKKVTSTPESEPDITFSASEVGAACCFRVRGAAGTSPRENGTAQSSATTTASIDPSGTGCLKVALLFDDPGVTSVVWGSSFAELFDHNNGTSATLSAATKEEDGAGAATFTPTPSGDTAGTYIFDLLPGTGLVQMAGTMAITFGGTTSLSTRKPIGGTMSITFGGSTVLTDRKQLSGVMPITFGGSTNLTVTAGGVVQLAGTMTMAFGGQTVLTDRKQIGGTLPITWNGTSTLTVTSTGGSVNTWRALTGVGV